MPPFFLMMLSVFLFSIYPLLCGMGLQKTDPIAFIFLTHLGCAVFSFVCGFVMLRRKKKKFGAVFNLDGKTWLTVAGTGTAAAVNHACLMYAFLKIPMISAAIIYETWAILAVWLTPILVVNGWQKVRRLDYIFGLLAFVGVFFIVSADSRELALSALRKMDPARLQGYGLALVASLGVCLSTMLRRNVTRKLREKYNDDLLLATYLSSGLTRMASLPVIGIILFFLYGQTGKGVVMEAVPFALVTGIAVHLMGSITYVLGVLKSTGNSVPVPDFIAPVLAVFFLYAFGFSGVSDYVILGGLFVITANLLVSVRVEENFAYTASILTLLVGGAYCYFTKGAQMDNFFDAISVSAVFYAILIAFAWDRVIDRSKHEEALVVDIVYDIEELRLEAPKKEEKLVRDLVEGVQAVISTSDHVALGIAFKKLQKTREEFGANRAIVKIYQNIANLILSKTKDIMLSEVVLLCLIGGVTFFGILAYRPPGLWPDMMAFIMAGAIVFIFFAIFDQLRERRKNIFSGTSGNLCVVNERVFESHSEFKLVTIALIGVMLAVFYGLFRYKYSLPPL